MKARLLPETPNNNPAFGNGSSCAPCDRRASNIDSTIPPLERMPPPESRSVDAGFRATPQVSNRPKGKLLLVAILIACLGFAVFVVWNTFLRYSAYGVVTGRIVELTSPWPANVEAVYVRAGDTVRQGDIIAIVNDPELEASIDRVGDELRSAQAELDAQVAMLAVVAHNRRDQNLKIRADYHDLKGRLLSEQSERDSLKSKLTRRLELLESGAVSSEEIVSFRYSIQALSDKIEHLKQAVSVLEERLEETDQLSIDEATLEPWFAKIEQSQAAIRRLREKQRRGTLRASTSGTVLAISRHVGERVGQEEPLIELLQDGSIELVVFVRQDQASKFQVGQTTQAIVEPIDQQLSCQVVRIGDRYEKPLAQIQSYYRRSENLLPVYLRPPTDLPAEPPLRLGSVVRVPAG